MGNTESHKVSDRLNEQLSALESKLESIESSKHHVYSWPDADSDLTLYGAPLKCKQDVKIVLGPVIGKVDTDSAVVMLEVSRQARITCQVTLVDRDCPEGRLFKSESLEFPANEPRVFHLKNLLPNQRYSVLFSGVNQQDATRRIGRFSTVAFARQRLKIAVVSRDDPYDHSRGETHMWEKVAQSVTEYNDPVHLVLHLGQQVGLKAVFDEAWVALLRHARSNYKSHLLEDGWEMVEAKAYEMFRQVYLFQWNLPYVAQVLASASNLMTWSEEDIYPGFTTRGDFAIDRLKPTREMQVVRALLRAARRAYHLYQRQLWDPNVVPQLLKKEAKHVDIARKYFDEAEKLYSFRMDIERRQDHVIQLRNQGDLVLATKADKELDRVKHETSKMEKVVANMDLEMVNERCEEYLIVMGSIAVLSLDLVGNRVFCDGSQAPENELWNEYQWQFMTECLSDNGTTLEQVHLLIVAASAPLVDSSSSWSDEQQQILTLISEWQSARPHREMLLLCGGSGRGLTTRVQDTRYKVSFQQFVPSPITAAVLPFPFDIRGSLHEDRYVYTHDLAPPERGFGLVCVDTENVAKIGIRLQHVGQSWREQPVQMVVGPIIGQVTSTTAIILVEIDQDGPLTCRVHNTLTTHEDGHVREQKLRANVPCAFRFTRLVPGQQYEVSFTGIENPERRLGSFQTFDDHPSGLKMALLTRDPMLSVSTETPPPDELWSSLARSVATPFSTIDLTLHLGGQVYAQNSSGLSEMITLLQSPLESASAAMNRMRNVYRHHWNLPHVRETLANGSNLMLWSKHDVVVGARDDDAHETVARLSHAVFREYQQQLWSTAATSSSSYHHSHQWGSFGLFCLDVQPTHPMIDAVQWKDLSLFMSSPLKTLVLASPIPFVDDSTDDARIKAECGNRTVLDGFAYDKTTLLQLLQRLMDWKAAGAERQVVLVAGSDFAGFESTIQQASSESSAIIRQIVLGPILAPSQLYPMEAQGSLDAAFIYQHSEQVESNHFGLLSLGPSDDDARTGFVRIAPVDDDTDALMVKSPSVFAAQQFNPPDWLKQLHEAAAGSSENEATALTTAAERLKTLVGQLRDSYQKETRIDVSKSLDLSSLARRVWEKIGYFYDQLDTETQHLVVKPSLYFVLYLLPQWDYHHLDERTYIDLATAVLLEAVKVECRLKSRRQQQPRAP